MLLASIINAQAIEGAGDQTEIPKEVSHRIPFSKKAVYGFDKYSDFIDRDTNYTPAKSYLRMLSEKLWGKDRQTQQFESGLNNYEISKER